MTKEELDKFKKYLLSRGDLFIEELDSIVMVFDHIDLLERKLARAIDWLQCELRSGDWEEFSEELKELDSLADTESEDK